MKIRLKMDGTAGKLRWFLRFLHHKMLSGEKTVPCRGKLRFLLAKVPGGCYNNR